MFAVTLNLSIDSILIKLFCKCVNFKEMKKKLQNDLKKKNNEKLEKNCFQNQESESFIQQISM